jgi:outer membrane protein OmpA-like peptidoglycan-associated protein
MKSLVSTTKVLGVGLAGGVALMAATADKAEAQGFQLNQFRAAETSNDGFAISSPNDLGHLDFGARLSLDYALNPLVYESQIGMANTERYSVVENQLSMNVGLALGLFDRVVVYAGKPATLFSNGSDMAPTTSRADGTQVGDPYLGVRVRLFGERQDVFALGLQLGLTFPLGDAASATQSYTGERSVTFVPRLMGEIRLADNRLRIGLNVGARIREGTDLLALRVGHELTFGAGITGVVVPDVFDLMLELYGATGFETLNDRGGFGGRESSPIELLLGGRVHPICEMEIGLAGGTGISRGYGAPDFRGVLMVGYAHDPHCRPAEPVVQEEEHLPGDTDGDGILDPDDQCPTEPEDVDTFEDTNGCPDPDNDQDAVLDVNDGAPMDPEDRDGFEDTDGVPDPDNDRDHILDTSDQCPNEPEDVDTFEDTNGCPDPDNDRDTVLDVNDQCPLAPGRPEDNGCPRAVRLDTETGQIFILQLVEFATNRDVILERSFPILEEVRAVIDANPQLTRLRVEGHTDDRGRDAANMDLSRRRAASVMRWLVEHGIAAERLEAWGCGELHPAETNMTAEGRQRNRRVEFHILSPAPASGPRQLEGCLEAAAPRAAATPRGRGRRAPR